MRGATVVLLLGLALPVIGFAADAVEVGLTGRDKLIEGTVTNAASSATPTVLLLGGLGGDDPSVGMVRDEARLFDSLPAAQRPFRLIAIPLANPDGVRLEFPPTGTAYREHTEANTLWRWIGLQGPDLVIVAGFDDQHLALALPAGSVAETGRIPAVDIEASPSAIHIALDGDPAMAQMPHSESHKELDRRRARTPRQLAEELARYYGHDFDQPWYINAIALIGQLRLGHLDEVRRLAEPYVNGTKNSLEKPNSLALAGHIVFTELARRTGDPRYTQLVRKVADLGFEADGTMKESMPFHGQFSDSVFMGTVIAAQAGALTGERKYFDLAARHVAFMQQLDLRTDGLYRHQPATDAAWGRGNAFPALGLALTLAEFPRNHPAYAKLLEDYRKHMAVLARYQDRDGLWRNVIDYPGAYSEYSATAMIGFSMLRGVRNGWLSQKEYGAVIDRAWRAILTRTGAEGRLVDVCESTAKMQSLDEYLHRAAILGPDPRGGAMALLFATEMANLK